MLDKIIYENHLGEKIKTGEAGLYINENDLRNYSWDFAETANKITGFTRGTQKCSLPLVIVASTEEEARKLKNKITEICEKDVLAEKEGRIWINGHYQKGYIVESKKDFYLKNSRLFKNNLTFLGRGVWIKEMKRSFAIQSVSDQDGLNFPFNFPFNFAREEKGKEEWMIPHYQKNDFELVVYGPCSNPKITINTYPYQIFTELEAGEYLVLSNLSNTIVKHTSTGEELNIYNSRQFNPSVFEKIPSGNLEIVWSGAFGFDLTLFLERSEPEW